MTTNAPAPVQDEGYTHKQILVIMSGLMLGMFLAALDQTIVSTALPTIVGDFKRPDLLSWVVTAYLLASTAATPLWGKAGDLYGRKRLFQLAIVVFLVGSVLCGLAQNMYELIAFRGLQGIGGGGMMSLVFAIIGDVIPPRERGRYQGYFGGVFGVSSVVGPLAGGFFVDQLSWRGIFYINLPLGIIALAVTNRVLKLRHTPREVNIDWLGAGLLVAAVSSLLLAAQSGGRDYAWGSVQIVGLFALGVVLLALFAVQERRAVEPILPLHLFANRTFSISNAIAFVAGVAMFGALAFLPQYLQIVRGLSATESGFMLLPVLVGVLTFSIASGRYISRTGNYRFFPLAGTLVLTVGLVLLTWLTAHESLWWFGLSVFVLGAGLGLFMQVLTIIVQNSVERRDLGVATSSVTFFRSMGGTIGASALGAVLSAHLASELPKELAKRGITGVNASANTLVGSPDAVQAIKDRAPQVFEAIAQAYTHSMDRLFLVAVPTGVIAFFIALLIKQVALRGSAPVEKTGGPAQALPAGNTLAEGDVELTAPAH